MVKHKHTQKKNVIINQQQPTAMMTTIQFDGNNNVVNAPVRH